MVKKKPPEALTGVRGPAVTYSLTQEHHRATTDSPLALSAGT